MRNAGLDETQARIKITGRNINNLRYADDATLTVESKEKLTNLLMKVKEKSEKAGLKFSIQKPNIHSIQSPHYMAKRWGKIEIVVNFIFLGSKIKKKILLLATFDFTNVNV